jgi:hypothetical protein
MTEDPYDRASRYLARREPAGVLCWLLRIAQAELVFERWLDTRKLPFPGQPERVCDTVAHALDVRRGWLPWALVLEFQLEPDALMFGRLLVYEGSVWLEFKPSPERGDRFHVGAVVVNLRGVGEASRSMEWPEAGLATGLRVVERNLEQEDAQATLAKVAAGEVSWVALAFVPLMHGGAEPGIIQEWVRLASAEADPQRRADLGLARVFAEAAGREQAWNQALQGWNMIESKVVKEWQAQERARSVLEVLEGKFGAVPPDLAGAIQGTTDLDTLRRWFPLALNATTLEQFRQDVGL